MTIESRITFPEGGTECPPEESTVASPTSSSLSNNANNGNGDNASSCQVNGDEQPKQNGLTRKRKKPGRPKRVVLETPKCNSKSNESSKPDRNAGEAKVGPGGSSSKTDDLKKSKTKNQNDGSKVDNSAGGAPRKSMRLLLRRGRIDNNYSGFLWPRDRPRYVEDLKMPLDFNDEKTKVMFMATLGLFPVCKEPKIDSSDTADKSSSTLREDVNESCKPILETNSNDRVVNDGFVVRVVVEPSDSLVDSQRDPEECSAVCPVPDSQPSASSQCLNNGTAIASDDDDDDEGWEIWVQRIPTYFMNGQGNFHQSPSQNEITESLKRLTQLGTEVVYVAASGL